MASYFILSAVFIIAGGVVLFYYCLAILMIHIWEEIGYWDGIDSKGNRIAGPKVKCRICGKEKRFTWQEWKRMTEQTEEKFS